MVTEPARRVRSAAWGEQTGFIGSGPAFLYSVAGPPGTYNPTCTGAVTSAPDSATTPSDVRGPRRTREMFHRDAFRPPGRKP